MNENEVKEFLIREAERITDRKVIIDSGSRGLITKDNIIVNCPFFLLHEIGHILAATNEELGIHNLNLPLFDDDIDTPEWVYEKEALTRDISYIVFKDFIENLEDSKVKKYLVYLTTDTLPDYPIDLDKAMESLKKSPYYKNINKYTYEYN